MENITIDKKTYRKISNILYKKFKMHWNSEEDVRDLIQDGMLRVSETIHRYDKKKYNTQLETFIYQVAHNKIIDILRKNSLSGSKIDNAEFNYNILNNLKEYSTLKKSAHFKNIKKLVNKFPYIYKEIFYLRYVYDLKFKDISNMLNKPLNTVKGNAFRLHDMIKKEYPYEKMNQLF